MRFLTDSRGNLSFFRLSIAIGVVGLLLIGAGYSAFLLDQASRRQPLFVTLPDNAQPWGEPSPLSPTRQQLFFLVPGADADQVAQFYDQQMRDFYDADAGDVSSLVTCERFPSADTFEDYDPQLNAPYFWKCVFDRSNFNALQFTEVTIQPGVAATNSQDAVVIRYDQRWQP